MKKLLFFLIISTLSFSTSYASQDIPAQVNPVSTLKNFSKNHSSAKNKKERRWNWRDRKAHPNTKVTNRLANLSFWIGIGAVIAFSAVAPIGLLLLPVSLVLGSVAWYRRPSKKFAKLASALSAAAAITLIAAIGFLIVGFVIWGFFWGIGKFFD